MTLTLCSPTHALFSNCLNVSCVVLLCWVLIPHCHNRELHSALIKATARWNQATTMAVTSHMQEQVEENTQTLNPHCWHFTLWAYQIKMSVCACADCTHTFTSPLNPINMGFCDSNASNAIRKPSPEASVKKKKKKKKLTKSIDPDAMQPFS